MRMERRVSSNTRRVQSLLSVILAAALPAYGQVSGDSYPAKPVKLVVPLATGGSVDSTARILATRLSDILHRQFVVENRLGAGGTIAFTMISRAPADGYTLLVAGT